MNVIAFPRRQAIEDDSDQWEERAHGVVDAVEELLAARRRAEVRDFCARAVVLLDHNAAEIGDDDAVRRVAARLTDLRHRASTAHPASPTGAA